MEYLVLTPKQLGSALKNRRGELDQTQTQVASHIGLLQKTVSALETHPERCGLESLLKLVSVLDLEIVLRPKSERSADPGQGEW
jgi:HTH-type transcriptional regulator / antitoxin HipB